MAITIDSFGGEHLYSPNPKMQGSVWSEEHAPIEFDGPLLINKVTGELFPNTPEFARRSDVLEPYYGDPHAKADVASKTVAEVNEVLTKPAEVSSKDTAASSGELETL